MEAIKKAGHNGKVVIGMDVAASEFYQDGIYDLDFKSKEPNPSAKISPTELLKVLYARAYWVFI